MPTAEEVANALAYEFLRDGLFSQSIGPVEVPFLAQAVAAGDGEKVVEERASEAFGNISVQSVGFEEGPDDPKVHLYLTRGTNKLIKSLPIEISGVPVRTHKMGNLTVRPDAAASATNHGHYFSRNNRVCCGSSCAPTSENCTGTLGALVRRNGSPQIYLLSNNHVFAGCNHVPRNQPILSPSSNDGKPSIVAPSEIGRHEFIHELRSGDPNFVNPCDADLALARATNVGLISSWQGDDADGYDTPVAHISPVSRMKVKKFGRTTALTTGNVQAKIAAPVAVAYTSKHFKGTVWFKDVWTVQTNTSDPFALPGDSGSLVVSEDGTLAVGVVFAANNTGEFAWIVPMPCVMGSFGGLTLVGAHGI
jgi:hypothetical protein